MDALRTFFRNFQFRRNAIWLIPVLLFVTFPLWSIPVGNFLAPRGGQNEEDKPQQQRNFNLQKVSITLNKNGRDAAFILASSAQTASPEILLLNDVVAQLYDKDGNITEIRAETGEYASEKEILTLERDVVVHKTIDKQVLYTQLLHYDNRARTVHCPGTTRIVAPDANLHGGSFDYDIETARYELGMPVECKITGFDTDTRQPERPIPQPSSEN